VILLTYPRGAIKALRLEGKCNDSFNIAFCQYQQRKNIL